MWKYTMPIPFDSFCPGARLISYDTKIRIWKVIQFQLLNRLDDTTLENES